MDFCNIRYDSEHILQYIDGAYNLVELPTYNYDRYPRIVFKTCTLIRKVFYCNIDGHKLYELGDDYTLERIIDDRFILCESYDKVGIFDTATFNIMSTSIYEQMFWHSVWKYARTDGNKVEINDFKNPRIDCRYPVFTLATSYVNEISKMVQNIVMIRGATVKKILPGTEFTAVKVACKVNNVQIFRIIKHSFITSI